MEETQTRFNKDFVKPTDIQDYERLISTPLKLDEKSLLKINNILSKIKTSETDYYGSLLYELSGINVLHKNSISHWKNIIEHKKELTEKVGRRIDIKTAVIDYFDTIGNENDFLKNIPHDTKEKANTDWLSKIYSYNFFQTRISEECQRAKRYGYSLSLLLIDVDKLGVINEKYGYKVGDIVLTRIIKIAKRSIRAVDIICRFRGDQFAIILPHENKREAYELAERIRANVENRSKNVSEVKEGFSVTISVAQYILKNSGSSALIQRARSILETGKTKKRNFVHQE